MDKITVQAFVDTKIELKGFEKVPVGKPVKFYGTLKWHCATPWCIPQIYCPKYPECCFGADCWLPLERAPVELYINGKKVDETTTQEEGYFEFEHVFEDIGEYIVQVHFPGDWKNRESWSNEIKVVVVGPDEYEQWKWLELAKLLAMTFGIPAGILIAYEIYKRKREEELLLIAALR
ncbi:MAG TPA: hypothetical protein ENG16_02505 [Archaeoglobus sp.]|nr:hypothetical protein [Archaeoglobus sp.]